MIWFYISIYIFLKFADMISAVLSYILWHLCLFYNDDNPLLKYLRDISLVLLEVNIIKEIIIVHIVFSCSNIDNF